MGWYSYTDWRPYVSVAQRRRQAARTIAKMKKAGRTLSPVEIAGRKITATFWGDAWCRNLESYSDYSNRLPRGRTYVRNGSVIDLQIEAGRVRSLVSGSRIYEVDIGIKPLAKRRWARTKSRCAGQIDSLVELLRGAISKGVMEIVTRKGEGLFPSPREISLSCSCPDWATMCKHVAATLYGVGARLDVAPELLFTLRGVDPAEMVETAVARPARRGKSRRGKVLASDELSSVFGVDIDTGEASARDAAAPAKRGRRAVRRKKSKKKKGKRPTAARRPGAKRSSAGKRAATKNTTSKRAARTKKPTTGKAGTRSAGKKARAKKTRSAKRAPRKRTSSDRP
jgi:uncharacterized Zn finger protein